MRPYFVAWTCDLQDAQKRHPNDEQQDWDETIEIFNPLDLFRFKKFLDFNTVVLLFLFDKHYL
jgi:hypothetical protein